MLSPKASRLNGASKTRGAAPLDPSWLHSPLLAPRHVCHAIRIPGQCIRPLLVGNFPQVGYRVRVESDMQSTGLARCGPDLNQSPDLHTCTTNRKLP